MGVQLPGGGRRIGELLHCALRAAPWCLTARARPPCRLSVPGKIARGLVRFHKAQRPIMGGQDATRLMPTGLEAFR